METGFVFSLAEQAHLIAAYWYALGRGDDESDAMAFAVDYVRYVVSGRISHKTIQQFYAI